MNDKSPSFSSIGTNQTFIERLAKLSITQPTAVQEQVIPVIATGSDVLFQSETGTGKTFAYLLPLLQKMEDEENLAKEVKMLIVAPTYELASQIKAAAMNITSLKTGLCIGGAPIRRQTEMLKEKPAIVIGNPARLMELIHLKKIRTVGIEAIIFDEADRMTVKELRDDTTGLLELMPKSVQFIACSATITDQTKKIFEKSLPDSTKGTDMKMIFLPAEDILRKRINHWAIYAERRDKIDTLRQLLSAENPPKALVFATRSDQVDNIVSKLTFKKIACAGLYSKTDKKQRKAAIDQFRNGKIKVLVTSDLAARGLDINGITHVIQMDMPSKDDFFIHRAGRTARAGKTGINCVIGDEYEMQEYAALEKRLKIIVHPKQLYGGKVVDPIIDDETSN